ncbi:MAG: SBBP repeat-containing protein, partial [Candidatus Thorarchaeota archaeon]
MSIYPRKIRWIWYIFLLFNLILSSMLLQDISYHDNKTDANIPIGPSSFSIQDISDQPGHYQFYQNNGQFDSDDVLFYSRVPAGFVGFGKSKLLFIENDGTSLSEFVFKDSNIVTPIGLDKSSGNTNYFLGHGVGYSDIYVFNGLMYEDIWYGLDITFLQSPHGISCEFNKTSNVNLTELKVEVNDFINLHSEYNILKFSRDFINRQTSVNTEHIPDNFLIPHIGSDLFSPSQITHLNPISYSSFLGGSSNDQGQSITIDSSGNVFIAGFTESLDFPVLNTTGSYNGGLFDCFVSKWTANGSLLFTSIIGGTGDEWANSIAVDSSGCVFVTGFTNSNNFPLANPYDSSHNGGRDCFVFKLNQTGNDLIYSTFIGGTDEDRGYDLVIDEIGNAYVTGLTSSPDFPTLNAYDNSGNGNDDSFILKLNSSGNGIYFSTYIGGSSWDMGNSIVVDPTGSIYITGYTESTDFPMVNAFNEVQNGYSDGFILKLSSVGDSLEYSTYLGGSGYDQGNAIAIDCYGDIYVVGETGSLNFPVNGSRPINYHGGRTDGFLTKFNSDGMTMNFSMFLGGTGYDYVYDIAIKFGENVIVCGETSSSDFPLVNAYDDSLDGYSDIFLVEIDNGSNSIEYSTLFGGNDSETALSLCIDDLGTVYVTGYTESADFSVFNSFDSSHNGLEDTFIFKLLDIGDSDKDLLLNYEEFIVGSDPNNNDTDNDMLGDGEEFFVYNTDPMNSDSDYDLMPDGWEVQNNLNPLSALDAFADPDYDELSNLFEYQIGTDPNNNDSDSDLMPDGWEILHDLNPSMGDANVDADSDDLSNLEEYQNNTDPNDNDSDDDLMPDGWEVQNNLNPLSALDALADPDYDELVNLDEYIHRTDPHDPDSDNDGILDGWEVRNGFDPLSPVIPILELLEYHIITTIL